MDIKAIKNFLLLPRGKVGVICKQNAEQSKKIEELEATIDGEMDWFFKCERAEKIEDG